MKSKTEIENKRFLLDIKIDDNKFKLLDDIIGNEIDHFGRLHPSIFALDGSSYIKEGEMKDIISVITSDVMKNMTPALKENLAVVYNFKNDSDLINLVGTRAGVLIAILVSEVNSSMEEEKVTLTSLDI